MKRFTLATPTKYEDEIIEDLGALGTAQLVTEYTIEGFRKVDTVEKCERYVKLQQRMSSVLSVLPPPPLVKKGFIQSLKGGQSKPVQEQVVVHKLTLDDIENAVIDVEKNLDERLGKLEKLRSELSSLKDLEEKLLVLQKHGIKSNDLGEFETLFVKAGFMNRAFSTALERYVEGTSVRFSKWPDRREEDFVVILGLRKDKPHMDEALTRLNFAELILPAGISPDPAQALAQNKATMANLQEQIASLEGEVRGICGDFQKRTYEFEPIVRRALAIENARSTFSRTDTLSLAHGWIPVSQQEPLTRAVQESTKGAAFLRFENPSPSDTPPVQISHSGVARSFELFTKLRGTPEYNEVDPTLIVTVLFTIMYGMMFGDIGQGAVLVVLGLIFTRFRRSFLGIPARGMVRLGGVLATCGASAMFFGALYGEFFLSEAFHPIFVNPIEGQTTMIIVALLFGVAQIGFGLVLKLANLIRIRAKTEAVFGGIRLGYYAIGVVLAVKYATSLSFTVFTENLGLTVIAIAALIVLFFSPAIEAALKHELKLGQDVMKGASEFIETFLSYLTNSISYVRLAAFAIAHSALGVAAVILSGTIGGAAAFILMNFLALTIEALGVFIQCMRLTYYEFFTKFYSGTGSPYRPFSLPKTFGTVN
jgi:V/A-type H+-transporting ATPase subunit I